MTIEQASAASNVRDNLEERFKLIRELMEEIKSDEVVDDNACDSVVAQLQKAVIYFNTHMAAVFGLAPIPTLEPLAPSPYQDELESQVGL
mgnify:CR=1 FL=1